MLRWGAAGPGVEMSQAIEKTKDVGAGRWALAGLSLSMLMPSLDTSIANVGLPSLARGFGASFQQAQWVVLAYDQGLVQDGAKGAVARAAIAQGPELVRNSVALVSGANGGIGSEIARALLRAGAAKIYCGARKLDSLRQLTAVAPDRLVPVQLDVTDAASIAAAVASLALVSKWTPSSRSSGSASANTSIKWLIGDP